MGKIKILPEHIANKIAAGEVVERPASVVKELVENALDAKASRIKIEIEAGGIGKITVSDDGEGMDKEDILKCICRHGTSKIQTEDDLWAIKSLGFRGEALSSIAAVSKMKIRSKIKEAPLGNLVEVEAGEIVRTASAGMPTGTSLTVEALFYNVPARKKFLKTVSTEFRQGQEVVTNNALAFPEIGFFLSHNKKIILDLPKDQSREERIREILSESLYAGLIPVFFDHPHLKISGFVSKPQFSSDRSYKQYTFVNKRRVQERVVAAAVKGAYGTLLPARFYPIFVLFLDLPYEMVDVNVHPRKEEVRFVNGSFIFNSVKEAVLGAWLKKDLTPGYEIQAGLDHSFKVDPYKPYRGGIYSRGREAAGPVGAVEQASKEMLPWEGEELAKAERSLKILQVHNLYLVTQVPNGLVIIDQHAAHERILYERFLGDFQKDTDKSQPLLLSVTFDLSASEADILRENLETLKNLGFEIEDFGKNSFKINSVPAAIKDRDPISLITSVIEDLGGEEHPKDVASKKERTLSFLACRSAIKAGDPLSEQERRDLLEKLDQTKTKYTCPHGRPVKIEISLRELGKMFKRS